MIRVENFAIHDVHKIWLSGSSDHRGSFCKSYHETEFRDAGLPTGFKEAYFSTSHRGVIRGMHFQVPPAALHKLVTCVSGEILDVLLDLRKGSPTFGQHMTLHLNAESGWSLLVPRGVAHGFLSLTEGAIVSYQVTEEYSSACDLGVRWDSFGCDWSFPDPILSSRDQAFPHFQDFPSPF